VVVHVLEYHLKFTELSIQLSLPFLAISATLFLCVYEMSYYLHVVLLHCSP